jgi:hypothetical protein
MVKSEALDEALAVLRSRRQELDAQREEIIAELRDIESAEAGLLRIINSHNPTATRNSADGPFSQIKATRLNYPEGKKRAGTTVRQLVFASLSREGRRTAAQIIDELEGMVAPGSVRVLLSKARSEGVLGNENGVWFFREMPSELSHAGGHSELNGE